MSNISEHVRKSWALGYGILNLQTQSIFVRVDALMSAALAIVGSKEFGCRPSIDANMCEIEDKRNNGNPRAQEHAFMGYPSDISYLNRDRDGRVTYGVHYCRTKWRGILMDCNILNLNYAEQAAKAEHSRSSVLSSSDIRPGIITAIDFLHLGSQGLRAPQVHKLLLKYCLEIPSCRGDWIFDRDGEVNFQVGDVFWLSMIVVGKADKNGIVGGSGYSGSHLGIMMKPANSITRRRPSPGKDYDEPASIEKEQVAGIEFLDRKGNNHESYGFKHLFERMVRRTLCFNLLRHGDNAIRLIPTGVNIESELLSSHVSFRRITYIPRAVNLSAVHPKLLQLQTQNILTRRSIAKSQD